MFKLLKFQTSDVEVLAICILLLEFTSLPTGRFNACDLEFWILRPCYFLTIFNNHNFPLYKT